MRHGTARKIPKNFPFLVTVIVALSTMSCLLLKHRTQPCYLTDAFYLLGKAEILWRVVKVAKYISRLQLSYCHHLPCGVFSESGEGLHKAILGVLFHAESIFTETGHNNIDLNRIWLDGYFFSTFNHNCFIKLVGVTRLIFKLPLYIYFFFSISFLNLCFKK